MDTPIVLDTTPVEQPISLDSGTNDNYLLSPDLITQRAAKFTYALANTPAAKPEDEVLTAIQSGRESVLRDESSSSINADAANKRYDLISKTLAAKQEPLTPEDVKNVDVATGYNFPYKYPIAPNSILEVNYGHRFASELDDFAQKTGDNNFWNYGQMVARNDIEAAQIFGDVTTAKYQYLITKHQDGSAKVANQSMFGYAVDFGKSVFPFVNPYYEAKLRGNIPGVGLFEGGLLGPNLDAQSKALHAMPFEQFTRTVDAVYKKLSADNPQIALAWLQFMLGQSSLDRVLNNVNTIGHLLDVPLIFSVGKTIYSRATLLNDIRTATATSLKGAADPTATKADILASVGDLGGSAVNNANSIFAGRVTGNTIPVKDALETLPEHMNMFKKDITAAKNLSLTQQNILLGETDGAISNAFKVLVNTVRPTRVNLESLTGDVLYKVQRTVETRYPGENNSLLGTTYPIRDPISNTSYSILRWGKDGGDLFPNYHEAADSAIQKGFRVTYDAEHLAELDARIDTIKKEIKAGPDMNEDVHGLNYHDTLPDTLRTLEEKRAAVSKKGGVSVSQQGLGYFIEKAENYRETERTLLALTADPKNPLSVSPKSWTNNIPYFSYLRTSEDTFSAEAAANRKAAVYPQATYLAMVKEEGKVIADFYHGAIRNDPITGELNPFYKRGVPIVRSILNKERVKTFNEVLDYSQKNKDPVTKIDGYYFTPEELNNHYLTTYGRPATFPEVQAYEAIKRWDELQRIFTQTMVYRNEARLGNATHTLLFNTAEGTPGRSAEFVGAILNKFPKSRGTMLVMGEDLKSSAVKDLGRTSLKIKDGWYEEIKTGRMKMIQLQYPDRMPLKDLGIKGGDSLIHFVLTPSVESGALRWDSVPRTGGGRFIYDYTHYLKIPNMKYESEGGRRSIYMNDITVAPVGYKSLGEDVAKKYNTVRALLNAGKEAQAKASFIHNGLEGAFEPWGKFRKKFNRWKDENGTWHDPIYNLEEDMRVVPKNMSIHDIAGKELEDKYGPTGPLKWRNTWRDGTRENNPGRNFQVQFTKERDAVQLQAIEDIGTTLNPIYNRTPAQKVDPLVMLNRGMRSTVNSLFMDDYKIYAVNSWLQEASSKLRAKDSQIWSSPFATFKTITKDSFEPGTSPQEIQRLMANHFKIDQLTNTPTVWDTFVHSVSQNLADAAYNKLGPTAASYITPTWLIHKLTDPFSFIRSVTFNAYLGLFSIPQLFVQSMTYVNMFAISPKYASQGSAGAFFHYLSRINKNPEILKSLDQMAVKMGWKPGEWSEAMREFDNTGFRHVGAEQGMMDYMHRTNIIQSGTDKFLEWGRKPFQWGEKNSRIGAWYVAFREFRDAHPTGRLTETDKAAILSRADFYYGNMSIASHSALNAGVLSLPTQFYMYSTRLAEMFWSGSRLGGTLAQRNLARARLVAVNAGMFGLPMALGVTGLPINDYIRKELMDNGYFGYTPPYVVAKNFTESLINEGLPSAAIASITGKWYNIGPREGLGGLSNLKDTLTQDAKFWKVAGGASASLTMNTFNNGIYPFLYQLYRGNYRNVKVEDLVDIFKEVSTVSSGQSWWVAMNSGKWINKNSDYISDTSKANATTMFLTGLRETGQADIWNKEATIKARDEVQKYALKNFALWMNRSLIASVNKDPENAQAFRNKAIAWLPASDFPPDKLGTAIVRALKGAESLIDRIDKEYYFDKAPQAQKEQLRKAFEYIRQHKGK